MVIVSLAGLLSRARGETIVVPSDSDCHVVVYIGQHSEPACVGIGMCRHRV
jgi:hypothetical protein